MTVIGVGVTGGGSSVITIPVCLAHSARASFSSINFPFASTYMPAGAVTNITVTPAVIAPVSCASALRASDTLNCAAKSAGRASRRFSHQARRPTLLRG